MTRTNDIRLRPDGSIDTAHYMRVGRQMRSVQAHRLARQARAEPRNLLRRLMDSIAQGVWRAGAARS